MKGFSIAGGSVPGTDHTKPGQPGWTNNHDAYAFYRGADFLVGVVCDGCGSAPHSEVGAYIGAQLATKSLARAFESRVVITEASALALLHQLERDLVQRISALGRSLDLRDTLRSLGEAFHFTLVGFAMEEKGTMLFSFGDGVVALNGEASVLGPFPGNAPPYIAYRAGGTNYDLQLLGFNYSLVPTGKVQSLMVGTDGVEHFMAAEKSLLPGHTEPLGPVSQFWTDKKFVQNPDAIRRRLSMANKDTIAYETDADGRLQGAPRIQKGLLQDDTTLVVVQRDMGA
jgi:hypothetical protein